MTVKVDFTSVASLMCQYESKIGFKLFIFHFISLFILSVISHETSWAVIVVDKLRGDT